MFYVSEEEIENYKEAFVDYDVDGSGNINILGKVLDYFQFCNWIQILFLTELGSVMKALGENPTQDELQDMINTFDDDGTGLIEFTEFLCLMATKVWM